MICISPYALTGIVSHTQYEFGSVLRFVENNLGLSPLSHSDTRAIPADSGCMNYSQSARPFTQIGTRVGATYFIHERPSSDVPDEE